MKLSLGFAPTITAREATMVTNRPWETHIPYHPFFRGSRFATTYTYMGRLLLFRLTVVWGFTRKSTTRKGHSCLIFHEQVFQPPQHLVHILMNNVWYLLLTFLHSTPCIIIILSINQSSIPIFNSFQPSVLPNMLHPLQLFLLLSKYFTHWIIFDRDIISHCSMLLHNFLLLWHTLR